MCFGIRSHYELQFWVRYSKQTILLESAYRGFESHLEFTLQ